MSVENWSTTAASNVLATTGVNFDEGQTPGSVNNSAREMMAQLKAYFNAIDLTITTTGSANAYVLTTGLSLAAYVSGQKFSIKPNFTNTGAATLNVDGLGAKNLYMNGAAVASGDVVSGVPVLVSYDGAQFNIIGGTKAANKEIGAAGVSVLSGHLYGLTLSNNVSDATNDIDIAAGIAIDATNARFMTLASALTKRLDASWTVGTGNGGLDTGSIANTTYHVFLIMRSDTGVVDALFSTSATSPTMPANYDYKRRIGSILREGGAIVGFVQDGDLFMRKSGTVDVNATNPGASAVTRTLSAPVGVRVRALVNGQITTTTTATAFYGYLSDLSLTDDAPSSGVAQFGLQSLATAGGYRGRSEVAVMTNTSAQVRSRLSASDANTTHTITTWGWIDTRGRLA